MVSNCNKTSNNNIVEKEASGKIPEREESPHGAHMSASEATTPYALP